MCTPVRLASTRNSTVNMPARVIRRVTISADTRERDPSITRLVTGASRIIEERGNRRIARMFFLHRPSLAVCEFGIRNLPESRLARPGSSHSGVPTKTLIIINVTHRFARVSRRRPGDAKIETEFARGDDEIRESSRLLPNGTS